MGHSNEKETLETVRCSIQGCPGEYESRAVLHAVRHRGSVIVIDHVPAEVCGVCGDMLFAPQTVRRIEQLLATLPATLAAAPLYDFAST